MASPRAEGGAHAAAGLLDKRFVEIHGVEREIEAEDCLLELVGDAVDPNGKRGCAYWDQARGDYAVASLDGLVLRVPEANLRECDHVAPDAGGYDLAWPAVSLARTGATFALQVADVLRRQKYCLIQMPGSDEMRSELAEAAKSRSDYTLPRKQLEEAYLGRSHESKIVWLGDLEPPESAGQGACEHFCSHLLHLSHALQTLTSDALGFRSCGYQCGTLLRVPLADPAERIWLSPGSLEGEEEVQQGLVERHLEFIQRRRLCLMYLIDGEGGSIELHPRGAPGQQPVRLPATRARLLVFRHDLLAYTYAPEGSGALALQTWILQEPQRLRLDGLEGSWRGLEAVMGGPAQEPGVQVNVMSAACRFPAAAYRLEGCWLAFVGQTDGFTGIPLNRWDMSLYHAEDAEQFSVGGKSATKHCGLISDDELACFDARFFGIPVDEAALIPCAQRNLLELSFEALDLVGFTKQSLRGAGLLTVIGDQGLDDQHFRGYADHPMAWLRANHVHGVSAATRLGLVLGLQGPVLQVDTACSSSLVSANTCHASLLRQRHGQHGIETGMSFGLMQITSPFMFIGLSAAGMLGRGGRCKTFDDTANGYNRGEGTGGLILRVSDDVEVAHDRIACYVGSYTNQDGRSASLTAPNGPAQQQCIRGSWRQAGLVAEDLSFTENHGTGTALGDPIETNSIHSVFRRRQQPFPITSGKNGT